MSIAVKICTIEKTLFDGEADMLTLPGSDGELGVLANHIPLITSLKGGNIRIRRGKKDELVNIAGGFAEIRPGSNVVVLAQ